MFKTFFAAAAVAAAAICASATAQAKTKIDLDVYLGFYDSVYPIYDEPVYRPHPAYFYDVEHDDDGISCEEGRETVREHGFRKVRAIDCDGRRYKYRARKGGHPYIVTVSSRSGDIIRVREAW